MPQHPVRTLLTLILAMACGDDSERSDKSATRDEATSTARKSSESDTRKEGTEPGDCSDGADNDADGEFDCKDSGCRGAPDCEGSESPVKAEVKETKLLYTSLDFKECSVNFEGGDGVDFSCKGLGGYVPTVYLMDGGSDGLEQMMIDHRNPLSYLTLELPGGGTHSFDGVMSKHARQGNSGIRVTDGKIEWRYYEEAGKKVPVALIFRVYTGKPSNLFVARLDGKSTCLIGVAKGNDEAREIAADLNRPCKN